MRWAVAVVAMAGCTGPPQSASDVDAGVVAADADVPEPDSAVNAPDASADDASVSFDANSSDAGPADAATLNACDPNAGSDAGPLGPLVTLSPNTTSDPAFDVQAFRVSPDESTVVFWGDMTVDGERNLYSAPLTGGSVVQLTVNQGPFPSENIGRFEITPDSSAVVYRGEHEPDGVARLYSVPIAGGSPTTLSQNLGPDTDLRVRSFGIAPDGQTVVFLGDVEFDGVERLYSVSIAGGAVTTLSQAATANSQLAVTDFAISPDSQRVVFRGDTEVDDIHRIYQVPIAGGPIVRLSHNNDNTAAGQATDVSKFLIDPSSTRVVFIGIIEPGDPNRLYSVSITGGAVATISQDTGPDPDLDVLGAPLVITPDGNRVVFFGDLEIDGQRRLYSAPIAGGTIAELSPGLFPSASSANVDVAHDSSAVVFHGFDTDGVVRVFAVPVTGGTPVTLSNNSFPITELAAFRARISPDSTRVTFVGDSELDEVDRVYGNCIAGGNFVTLSPNDTADTSIGFTTGFAQFAPDNDSVLFVGDMFVDDAIVLTRASFSTGASETVDHNTTNTPGLHVDNGFVFTVSGSHVVFMADSEVDDVTRLYSREL